MANPRLEAYRQSRRDQLASLRGSGSGNGTGSGGPAIRDPFDNALGMPAWQQAVNQGIPVQQAQPTLGQQLVGIAQGDYQNEVSLQDFRNQSVGQQAGMTRDLTAEGAEGIRSNAQELLDLQMGQGAELMGTGQAGHEEVMEGLNRSTGQVDRFLNQSAAASAASVSRAEEEYGRYEESAASLQSATAFGQASQIKDSVSRKVSEMRARGASEAEIQQTKQMMEIDGARQTQASLAGLQEENNRFRAQLGMNVSNAMAGQASQLGQLANIASEHGRAAVSQMMGSQQIRNQMMQAGMGMQQSAVNQYAQSELQATQYELMGMSTAAELEREGYNFVSALDSAVVGAQLLQAYQDEGYMNYQAAGQGQSPLERFRRGGSGGQGRVGTPRQSSGSVPFSPRIGAAGGWRDIEIQRPGQFSLL